MSYLKRVLINVDNKSEINTRFGCDELGNVESMLDYCFEQRHDMSTVTCSVLVLTYTNGELTFTLAVKATRSDKTCSLQGDPAFIRE